MIIDPTDIIAHEQWEVMAIILSSTITKVIFSKKEALSFSQVSCTVYNKFYSLNNEGTP